MNNTMKNSMKIKFIIFSIMLMLCSCGEEILTFKQARSIIINKHPDAVIMSCQDCDEMTTQVTVFYRHYDVELQVCFIWKAIINTGSHEIISDDMIAGDTKSSCISSFLVTEKGQLKEQLQEYRDLLNSIQSINCY
jgi:hypothetical protein